MTTSTKIALAALITIALAICVVYALDHVTPLPPSPAPAPPPIHTIDTVVIPHGALDTVTNTVIAYIDTAQAKADTSLAQAAILNDLARVLADSGRFADAYHTEQARGDTLRVRVDSLRAALGVVAQNRDRWQRLAGVALAQNDTLRADLLAARQKLRPRLTYGPCVASGVTVGHGGMGHATVLGACVSYAL